MLNRAFNVVMHLLVVASASVASAQAATGSIAGTITDPSGAAVPNATVTMTDKPTDLDRTTTTDEDGNYTVPKIPPGTYTVTVEAPGFKKFEQDDNALCGTGKAPIGNISLEVGAISQSVTVTAQAAQVQTASAERSTMLNANQVVNLALRNRNELSSVRTIPGVEPDSNTNVVRDECLRFNGTGIDADQEFRILTTAYDAAYGRSSGAQISVVTKTGANEFHGSGYWFHRNDLLDANNWKNNRNGLFGFNDQGFTLGGPVYIPKLFNRHKDKAFFFVNNEYQRRLKPNVGQDRRVPTTLDRAGDFSQSVDKSGNPNADSKDYTTGKPCGTHISNTASFATNDAPFYNYNTTIEYLDNLSNAAFNGNYHRYRNVLYAQDTWQVNRRLTLEHGLRYTNTAPHFPLLAKVVHRSQVEEDAYRLLICGAIQCMATVIARLAGFCEPGAWRVALALLQAAPPPVGKEDPRPRDIPCPERYSRFTIFLWGAFGRIAVEMVQAYRNEGKDGRYKKPWFWITRLSLVMIGGGLAVGWEAPNLHLAFYIGLSAPWVIQEMAKSVAARLSETNDDLGLNS
jgi:hypothetical protein